MTNRHIRDIMYTLDIKGGLFMGGYTIKTVLTDGEEILFCQLGTIMTGTRVSGNIILTNK